MRLAYRMLGLVIVFSLFCFLWSVLHFDLVWNTAWPRTINVRHATRGAADSPAANVEVVDESRLPYEYPDIVDFRVIVLAYNRPRSLQMALDNVQSLILDGHTGAVNIWIDRFPNSSQLDGSTLQVAREFVWKGGPVHVHVHSKHVGLYGQWMSTWRPRSSSSSNEIVLYLEDDTDVSPYALVWLKSAHGEFGRWRNVSGYCLQDEGISVSSGAHKYEQIHAVAGRPHGQPAFWYRVAAQWGFSPAPGHWRQFQDWYASVKTNPTFHPYVPQAEAHTRWYKYFESHELQRTMWSTWLLYFTDKHQLFALYPDLPRFTGRADVSLAINRREPGLHSFPPSARNMSLLNHWNRTYGNFKGGLLQYDYAARQVL